MRYRGLIVVLTMLGAACLEGTTAPNIRDDEPEPWREFSVEQMRAQQIQRGVRYHQAHGDSTFRMGLFHVPAALGSNIILHPDNVLYYVVEGSGSITVAGSDYDFDVGSVLLVRGDIEHLFLSLDSDLRAVVIFPAGLWYVSDPEFAAFTAEELVAGADPSANVFTPLFDNSTMNVGTYMLPKGGDDDPLVHEFSEFKLVMSGGGRFDIANSGLEVSPGSIAYIESGAPHSFRRISDDLHILVVWSQR